jgi:hypothetical protein
MPPKRKIHLPADHSVMGPEYQRRIQEVDPDLLLTHHRLTGWAVWREEADERGKFYRLIARRDPLAKKETFDINKLCTDLRQRDTFLRGRSHVDQMIQHLKERDDEERQKEARMAEAFAPHHEKLAWTVARATGDLSVSVSPGSWKDKVR